MRTRLLMLFALFTLMIAPAFAQDETDDGELSEIEITFVGEVAFEEIDGEVIVTVGGVVISDTSAFNPAFLVAGNVVEITGILLEDDSVRATAVNFDPVIEEEEVEEEIVDEEDVPDEEEIVDDEEEAVDEENVTDGRNCVPDSHPVANRIAQTFDVSVTEVIALHCAGNGFGNITRAYILAEIAESEGNASDYLDRARQGGWGAIIRESGVHPSALAPGRMGRYANTDEESEEGAEATTTNTRGNSGNAPGNSGNAPGNSGNSGRGNSGNSNAGPGNSGNAPGNSGNAPGNSGGRGGRGN